MKWIALVMMSASALSAAGAVAAVLPEFGHVIGAPADPADWPAWRTRLDDCRQQAQAALDLRIYDEPAFAWVDQVRTCYKVMLWDQRLLDAEAGCYRLDRFLDRVQTEFGPIDALLVWHGYPNLGFDDKNQYDFYRNLPGGLAALRTLGQQLRRQGKRFFVAYNPWDTGTRREHVGEWEALVDFVCAVGADAVLLDTLEEGPVELRRRLDAIRPGVALQSELPLPLRGVVTHHQSWGQWLDDSPVPGVLRNRWVARGHVPFMIRRWDTDHSGELHLAWMNGAGMLIWENVFGSWRPWSARDRALLRAMRPVQEGFASWFRHGRWTPLMPVALAPDVYATQWDFEDGRLWTVVNRRDDVVCGALFRVELAAGQTVYDLLAATPVPLPLVSGDGLVTITGRLGPRGVGAWLAAPSNTGERWLARLLAFRSGLDPCWAEDAEPASVAYRIRRVPPPAVPPATTVDRTAMATLPAMTGPMTVRYRRRECGFYQGAAYDDQAYPNLHQPGTATRTLNLGPLAIDIRPVSNARYARFLQESGYCPRRRENFLKHWVDGAPPSGAADKPVVYVDLDDARAYAAHYGLRLPTEFEWQYAAEQAALDSSGPPVWNWTESEHDDGITRFCLLKGGSDYQAHGSFWYAAGGRQAADFAAKYLLTWPGLDRCATIGFRCLAELPGADASAP